jgi:hypothetical protein
MGDWDDSIKLFVRENAQDLVTWLWKGAIVKRSLRTEFKVRTIEADSVLEVELENDGDRMLFHIEFQASKDPAMPKRLLQYSVEAEQQHNLPVYSCVIYLKDVGEVPQPPLLWKRLDGREILWFDYLNIELAKFSVEDLRQTGLVGLRPLWVLAKDGATQEVVKEVVTELGAEHRSELLSVSRLFVDLIFPEGKDQEWVERIFAMSKDIFAETPTYKKLVGMGREEGLRQGKLEGLRQALVGIVEIRFPTLVDLARENGSKATQPETVELVLKGLVKAPDEGVARAYLELLAA